MLQNKVVSVCILALAFSFISVHAHNVPDPGPSIIEGNIANMSNSQDAQIGYDRDTWRIIDGAVDSQNNIMLLAGVSLVKRLYYHLGEVANWDYYATGGTANAGVAAAATASGFATHGDYYIKAKARGKWFWGSKTESKSYNNGVSKRVSKSAGRFSANPTLSGVHLWGKAKVDNQFDDVEVVFEWL